MRLIHFDYYLLDQLCDLNEEGRVVERIANEQVSIQDSNRKVESITDELSVRLDLGLGTMG
jgi:hypothetical protein